MTSTADQAKSKSTQETSASFETLFQDYWPRVCAVLYRLVGDRAEAEDLALEAFWRLYRQPPVGADRVGQAAWLFRVATNLGFNALRARKRRKRYEEQAGNQFLEADQPWDPAAEIERAQEREQVQRVLIRMKSRSAQLLILRHSGLSYSELASALGLAPGSIGTLLARAEQEFEHQMRMLEGE